MTPLERAARALCSADGANPEDIVRKPEAFEHARATLRSVIPTCQRWETYVPQVRAVLQAIREPSEAMVQAWFDAPLELPEGVSFQDPAEIVDPYHARSDWRAMIDAALEEG